MKKLMVLMLCAAVLLSLSACGIQPGPAPGPKETAAVRETPKPEPEETEEPVDPLVALWSESAPFLEADDAIAMSNSMNCGLNWIEGDTLYGCFYRKGSRLPQVVSMPFSVDDTGVRVSDARILDPDALPNYLYPDSQTLVYLRQDQKTGEWSLVRTALDGSAQNTILLSDSADYVSIRDGLILYTDENRHPVCMDMDGGSRREILGRAVAFPYFVNSEWLLYQNLDDQGCLYLTHLPSGTDIKLSDRFGAYPVLDGDLLYFVTPDETQENAWHLCRVDLKDWQLETDDTGSSRLLFTTERSDHLIGIGNGAFFLDGSSIYGVNGSAVPKDQWASLENDGYLEIREQYSFVNNSFRVTFVQNAMGVTEIHIYSAENQIDSAIPWL